MRLESFHSAALDSRGSIGVSLGLLHSPGSSFSYYGASIVEIIVFVYKSSLLVVLIGISLVFYGVTLAQQ